MDVKAMIHEELVNEHYYYCKDSVGYGEPIETPTGIELMRRLTPQVTGDVGELLDELWERLINKNWPDMHQLFDTLRLAVADLQADRERLEWSIKHDARCYSRSILYRKVKYFVNYRKEGNVFVNTACFDTPRAAIDAAMKGADDE